ncbi:vitelline membrane outer layer protein 1-like [Carassius carassius]|uniref:vitelline membrane outer layer protein 1-like n=1 Tax=Carassius carassius TaxID=217509 RepID=UPI00286900D1|nr:vitelline membrane outer layer protein 1-like [Carassius carassius]XP_059424728.1 vitelline membrane outer layer protein 1-like [Carassius carassius]
MHHFISVVFSLLIFTGLHVSVQSTGRRLERSSERHFRSLLTVSNGMHWGSWGRSEFCPDGTYAKGFNVKVERYDYFDNTALNAISLFCESKSEDASGIIRSDKGSFGQWIDYVQMCPNGFLTAFQLKVESSQGIDDDTAVNNIRFTCSGGHVMVGEGTPWGQWGKWSPTCQGTGICGIRTRIEEPQGFGDDTALNDVIMYCCD